MTLSRRNLLKAALAGAVPGIPAAVCAQFSEDTGRKAESASEIPYTSMPEVQQYIEETAAAEQLPKSFIEDVIGIASYSRQSERLMTPRPAQPGAPKSRGNWAGYRSRMVNKTRVNGGLEFLSQNEAAFSESEELFGVPRDITAAIIGVETVYGRNQGSFRVIDVLCTLTFDYKRRADYFRSELTQFLLLLREQKLNPAFVYGSFAGAIGMGQFMPSSIRRYAVDFDRDGLTDLRNSEADAIGSVANYLAQHGWVRGLPAYFSCSAEKNADLDLVKGGTALTVTLDEALAGGFVPDFEVELPGNEPLLIADLPYTDKNGEQKTEYRLCTRNFQTILTYNRSYFYASAVADLAKEIEAASIGREESRMAGSAAS